MCDSVGVSGHEVEFGHSVPRKREVELLPPRPEIPEHEQHHPHGPPYSEPGEWAGSTTLSVGQSRAALTATTAGDG